MSVFEYVDKSFICLLIIIAILVVIAIAIISCMTSLKEIKNHLYFITSKDQDDNQ